MNKKITSSILGSVILATEWLADTNDTPEQVAAIIEKTVAEEKVSITDSKEELTTRQLLLEILKDRSEEKIQEEKERGGLYKKIDTLEKGVDILLEKNKKEKKNSKKTQTILGIATALIFRKELIKLFAPLLRNRSVLMLKRLGIVSGTISLSTTHLSPDTKYIKTRTLQVGALEIICWDKDIAKRLQTKIALKEWKILLGELKNRVGKKFKKKITLKSIEKEGTTKGLESSKEEIISKNPKTTIEKVVIKESKIGKIFSKFRWKSRSPESTDEPDDIIIRLSDLEGKYFDSIAQKKLSSIDADGHTDIAAASHMGIEIPEVDFVCCVIIKKRSEESHKKEKRSEESHKQPELIMAPKSFLEKIRDSGYPEIQEEDGQKIVLLGKDKAFLKTESAAIQYESYRLLARKIETLDIISVPAEVAHMVGLLEGISSKIDEVGRDVKELRKDVKELQENIKQLSEK